MRIGIDCRLWNESGVGRYTRNLVRELSILDKKNQYVLFVLKNAQEDIQKLVQNDNFRTVKADIRWHSVEEQINYPLLLNNQNLDLMHFPYFSVPLLYRKPFVVTIHDLILHSYSTGEASTLPLPLYKAKLLGYKFIISKAAKNAEKIIVPTNAVKEDVIKHLKVSEDKIVVTYEGSDSQIRNSKFEIRNNSQNPKIQNLKHQTYFLYVGNAYPHKNLERLIQAFKLLIGEKNDVSLVLVGREDYFYKRLKERVKKMGLEGSVRFTGEVSDTQLRELYRGARALIIPSLMEGFGLPALEAMSNKCLVLCSDIPSLREICSDAPIYFSPFSIEELTSKMAEVCFNDLNHFSKKINEGFKRSKKFSWEKMTRETLKIYESCIGLRQGK